MQTTQGLLLQPRQLVPRHTRHRLLTHAAASVIDWPQPQSNQGSAQSVRPGSAKRAAAPAQQVQKSDVRAQAQNGRKREGFSLSLYHPYTKLPPEGKTLTPDEETCDPMTRNCQTPMHVWETKCTSCYGSGTVTASGRGRRRGSAFSCSTCVTCHGLGFVRRVSSAGPPDSLNNGTGNLTLNRPEPRQ